MASRHAPESLSGAHATVAAFSCRCKTCESIASNMPSPVHALGSIFHHVRVDTCESWRRPVLWDAPHTQSQLAQLLEQLPSPLRVRGRLIRERLEELIEALLCTSGDERSTHWGLLLRDQSER